MRTFADWDDKADTIRRIEFVEIDLVQHPRLRGGRPTAEIPEVKTALRKTYARLDPVVLHRDLTQLNHAWQASKFR